MSNFIRLLVSSSILLSGLAALAEFPEPRISSDKHLRIRYINPEWNASPGQRDTGTAVIRDRQSSQSITLELVETALDSGIFEGVFSIRSIASKTIIPQIYILDGKTSADQSAREIRGLIAQGRLVRKPFFLRKDNKKADIIQIFDSPEDALAAYEDFQRQIKSQKDLRHEATKAAEAIKESEARRLEQLRSEQAKQQELERTRLAEIEQKKLEELKQQQLALSKRERENRKREAKELAEQAMVHYRNNDFEKARDLFSQSAELDPANTQYNFQYGVTLYKLGEYNQSLVVLGLAEGEKVSQTEKTYYLGLNHLKLKEFDQALEAFTKVRAADNEVMSPAAAFYSGVLFYQIQSYDDAQNSFQYVLDHSKDPKLDEQAEVYIEQIARNLQFQEMAKRKFLVDASIGFNYDSNVLMSSDSTPDQGTATDKAGYRTLFSGSASYRPIYTPVHEFLVRFGATDMYTLDTSFAADATLQAADPLLFSISAPYTYKTSIKNTAYQLRITPSFETLYMNIDAELDGIGNREQILGSLVLMTNHTFVISNKYVTSIQAGLRSDDSKIEFTDDHDNASAMKYNLSSTHTFFTNKENSKAWILDFGLTQNEAEGANYKFTRFDIGVSYMTPIFWESQLSSRLGYYNSSYPDHSEDRTESNISLTAGIRKPHTQSLASSYLFSYTSNDSNLASSEYQKLSLMALLTWSGLF